MKRWRRWLCRHKRRKYTGRTRIDLDERGLADVRTAKLIYICCACKAEVVR